MDKSLHLIGADTQSGVVTKSVLYLL